MPLFDYECPIHGKFEVLYNASEEVKQTTICLQQVLSPLNDMTFCGLESEICTPLVAMQPDTMWAGVNTQQGYFTSKKQYLNNLREKNLETITTSSELENVRKNVVKTKIAKIEKQKESLEKHLTEELKGVTIDPDGNTLKEKNRYARKRN